MIDGVGVCWWRDMVGKGVGLYDDPGLEDDGGSKQVWSRGSSLCICMALGGATWRAGGEEAACVLRPARMYYDDRDGLGSIRVDGWIGWDLMVA